MLELSSKQRIWLALFILIPVLLYWGFSGTPAEIQTSTPSNPTKIDYFVEQAVTTEWNTQGQKALTLQSQKVEHLPAKAHSLLTSPHSIHYRDNQPPLEVTANSGQANDDNQRIDLAGNVVVHDNSVVQQPTIMRTQQLTIYQTQEYAETDKPVKITSAYGNMEGVGMDIQFQERRLNLHSRVKGIHIDAQ